MARLAIVRHRDLDTARSLGQPANLAQAPLQTQIEPEPGLVGIGSRLLVLKTRALLPRPEVDEPDEANGLRERSLARVTAVTPWLARIGVLRLLGAANRAAPTTATTWSREGSWANTDLTGPSSRFI